MNSTDVYTLYRGTRPLLVSLPHVGTQIPEELRGAYVERALNVEDTDWHLEALYGFAHELGASLLVPRLSRYVIDLNRPPAEIMRDIEESVRQHGATGVIDESALAAQDIHGK